ncbi:MAG: response regulator transcription factor, partial [Chloroflexi bacterium]|nr:response regulator transcription factor [Chloroflexota bacterium]
MQETPHIRVLLVDDHQHIHDIVTELLNAAEDIDLVGQVHSGHDAVALCRIVKPDLVLMDVIMPVMSGAETTRVLLEECPDLRVLVMSSFREYERIKEMLDSGALGYLVKDAIAEDLLNTIRAVYQGNMVFSPEVAETVLFRSSTEHTSDFGLTERE